MKNYAILLGVSKYEMQQEFQDLSACKKDIEIMQTLLEATQKYDILVLDENIDKREVLDKIDDFLSVTEDNDNNSIGEIMFYFSGHGYWDFDEESDNFLVLYNTETSTINTTAIKHSEIDGIIKGKNPRLYVKIIDACYSGMNYIKSTARDTTKIISESVITDKKLNDVFFMFSSEKEQPSWATTEYSYFTKSFVDAVIKYSDDTIRYNDIKNYIADAFQSFGQTPRFVTQDGGRDIFTNSTSQLKEFVKRVKGEIAVDVSINDESNETVNSRVSDFLKRYRTQDSVKILFDEIDDVLSKTEPLENWIQVYYQMQLDKGCGLGEPGETTSIVKFLYDKLKSEHLHIEIDTEDVRQKSDFIPFSTTRTVPVKFHSKARGLPSYRTIEFVPKNEGLPRYELSFVFVYSDTFFYTFTASNQYLLKGWSDWEKVATTKYTYQKTNYCDFTKDEWISFVNGQVEKCYEFIESSLEKFIDQSF